MWIKNPTNATVCRYLFTAKLLYMFRVSQHPSSGVLKTVPATSGTGHTTCTATPLQRGLIATPSRSDHDYYVCTVHLVYSFYFNQQCTIYIYIYIFFNFNNAYIIITPTCFDSHHPSTLATSAQVYPNNIHTCKHITHTNYTVKIM